MIDKLSLVYNRARQAAITTELTEIISGAEALDFNTQHFTFTLKIQSFDYSKNILGANMEATSGKIVQVMALIVDIEFNDGHLPKIMTALTVSNSFINEDANNFNLEVAQHLGENTVRAISMDTTDGLTVDKKLKILVSQSEYLLDVKHSVASSMLSANL